MPVQVIIKSAAQTVEDFTLDCELTWTIAQVKDQISTLYPTKPKREHQKLIYGGKLLPDHLTLESVLNKMQDIHILHIVCPFTSVPLPKKSTVNTEVPTAPLCTASPPTNSSSIYPQVNQQLLTTGLTSGIPGIVNGGQYTAPDAAQQYFAMQQMYTQFMTQYFAQYNGVPYSPITPNITPVQQQQPPTAPRPPPNAPPRGDEVVEARDYIDYLYTCSRVAILVAMLLFYSSLHRVIAVCVMVFLLMLFAKINRHNQQQELQRTRERQNAPAAATEQQPEEAPTTENEQNSENAVTTGPTAEDPPQAPTSVPSTILTLITAFFSSLIPTDPIPVHVN